MEAASNIRISQKPAFHYPNAWVDISDGSVFWPLPVVRPVSLPVCVQGSVTLAFQCSGLITSQTNSAGSIIALDTEGSGAMESC